MNTSQGVSSETKAGATVYYTRMPGGKLVSQRTGSATYYYLFDGQGSVVGLVDASGNVVASYSYDPYGQTVVKTGSAADGNPWRYTGAYLDATGLYKMGERYYDPARGRFTQLDPLGNGYVYAADNPVNFVDPSGLNPSDEFDPSEAGIGPPAEINGSLSAGRAPDGSIQITVEFAPGYTPNFDFRQLIQVEFTPRLGPIPNPFGADVTVRDINLELQPGGSYQGMLAITATEMQSAGHGYWGFEFFGTINTPTGISNEEVGITIGKIKT